MRLLALTFALKKKVFGGKNFGLTSVIFAISKISSSINIIVGIVI